MKATEVIRESDLIFWLKEFGEHAAEEFIHELGYLREEVARLKREAEFGYHDARREWEREAIATTDAQRAQLEQVQAELRQIDSVMARRPALDKPTRWQNIEHAIDTAKRAEIAEAQVEALQRQLRSYRAALS